MVQKQQSMQIDEKEEQSFSKSLKFNLQTSNAPTHLVQVKEDEKENKEVKKRKNTFGARRKVKAENEIEKARRMQRHPKFQLLFNVEKVLSEKQDDSSEP